MKQILFTALFLSLNFYLFSQKVVPYSIPNSQLQKAKRLIQEHKAKNQKSYSLLDSLPSQTIYDDLNFMLNHPNSCKLNHNGYYCGVLAILNWLINTHPEQYTKAVLDLAFNGETQAHGSKYKIVLPQYIRKIHLALRKKNSKERIYESIKANSISDFILTVSLNHSEKLIQKAGLLWSDATYNKESLGNFIFSNTMPWEMDDYFERLGFKVLESGLYKGIPRKKKLLEAIEQECKAGRMPILFENHHLTSTRSRNKIYKFIGAHYISIHNFNYHKERNSVSYSYWDYGSVKDQRELNRNKSVVYAKSLKQAARWQKRINRKPPVKITKEISVDHFFKALRGYWFVN